MAPKDYHVINPFLPNAPFLYPLKTSEKSKVIQGVILMFSGGRESVNWEGLG